MGTAIKHPVPDRVKPSLVIFHIRALWRSELSSECPDVKNYKWHWLNPVWHGMLYSCTHMATVGVKGLTLLLYYQCINCSKWLNRSLYCQCSKWPLITVLSPSCSWTAGPCRQRTTGRWFQAACCNDMTNMQINWQYQIHSNSLAVATSYSARHTD